MKFFIFLVSTFCSASLLSQTYFENRSEEFGANVIYEGNILGAGISFFDYNDDGFDDITLAGSVCNDYAFLSNEGGLLLKMICLSLEEGSE